MKKSVRLIGALLFGSVSFVAFNAYADEPEGWYVGANGGLNENNKQKTDLVPTTTHFATGRPTEDSKITDKNGWVGAAEVGYNWGNNIRTEFEGTFSETNVRRYFGFGASGRTDTWGGFVNAFYDFDLTQFDIALPIVPYIGAGVGAMDWGQSTTRVQGISRTNIPGVAGNGVAFAYQAIGGFAYNIDDNWAATADFRYIDTPTLQFGSNKPRYVTNDLTQEQVLLGVRYTFAEPEPAPMPGKVTPPPVAQKTAPTATSYMVFFDFNKYNLTPEAMHIVDNAAAAAKGNSGVTQIDVTGHTDTVGSDAYNMKLSRRRADSVKAELVKQGVPAKEIAVFAKGKRDPLVPTGDGVREPQNRRVEIVFH
jgi:outer membrane protein OmpA-like peptidoglycan-associated protein